MINFVAVGFEEIMDPRKGFLDVRGEVDFGGSQVEESVRFAEIRGSKLGVMETFMDGGN